VHGANVLTFFPPILPSLKAIGTLLALHPLDINSPYLDSLLDFQLDLDLELSINSFKSAFFHMFHLSSGGPFGMVFEHFQFFISLKI